MNQAIEKMSSSSILATNKVLKNTFMLLGATLLFSSLIAYGAIELDVAPMNPWIMLILYFVNLFALHKFQNSSLALPLCFSLTGLLGYTLGPLIGYYMSTPGGEDIVTTSMAMTALMFFGLSGYALTTKKDFSFMTGFVTVGIIVAFVGSLIALFFAIPALALTVSVAFMFLSSALILIQLGEIVNGGETNYVMATVTIFVSIYNIFASLLHLLGWADE